MTELILQHPLEETEVFTPEALIQAVQAERGIRDVSVPRLCVLDFDGDLTDKLSKKGVARPYPDWACFHTQMMSFEVEGAEVGIIPRTIGGPYAVLVAEQLFVSGARAVVGLTSAGRISRGLALPHVVVADEALRDEGTSYHYIPPSRSVTAPSVLAKSLFEALKSFPLPVARGLLWTTDAPYRETVGQIRRYASENVLAVEMQAASLFALARRKGYDIGVVAHVTNAVEETEEPFHKGPEDIDERLLRAVCRAALRYLREAGFSQ